jgi:hypothetical protein
MPHYFNINVVVKVLADSAEDALEIVASAVDNSLLLEQDNVMGITYPEDNSDIDTYYEEGLTYDYREIQDDSDFEDY